MYPSKAHSKGASVLIAVMIISAALIVIAIANMNISIGDADLSLAVSKGEQAYEVAQGCAEDTLRNIKRTSSYGIGTGTISFTTSIGSCTIDVTDLGGNQRSLNAIGSVGDFLRRITIQATVNADLITIQSWKET